LKKVLLLVLLLTVSCRQETAHIVQGIDGESIVGPQGERGEQGEQGQDGFSIVSANRHDEALCGGVGGTTLMLAQDTNRNNTLDEEDSLQTQFVVCDGIKGDSGNDGSNGTNGISCEVSKEGSISTLTCGESSIQILDGVDGAQGEQGPAGLPGLAGSIIEVVTFCPGNSSHKEVGLRISPNIVVAFFQQTSSITINAPGGHTQVLNGLKGRLVILSNGTYITTDNAGCQFTINDGQISN
jgi:hypothetical protein